MKITKDRLVILEYTLTDAEGTLLNTDDEPLIYLQGHGQIFAKVEEALEGKEEGAEVRLELPAVDAFGEHNAELMVEELLEELPDEVCVGMELDGYLDEDPESVIIYTVTHVGETTAVLDANHPLAGKALLFEGKVLEVQELSEEAIREILLHRHD